MFIVVECGCKAVSKMARMSQNLGHFLTGKIPTPLNVSSAVARPRAIPREKQWRCVHVHLFCEYTSLCSLLCFCLTRSEPICPLRHLKGISNLKCSKEISWFPHPLKLTPCSSLLYFNNWQFYSFCSSDQNLEVVLDSFISFFIVKALANLGGSSIKINSNFYLFSP